MKRLPHYFLFLQVKCICISQDGVCLYGVFDGHVGSSASNFASQRMPAELLLGQLSGNTTDEAIKEVFYQAFVEVKKRFFNQ